MLNDKQFRTGIFGVAIVGLVLASVAGDALFDNRTHGPYITVDSDFDDDDMDENDYVQETRDLATFSKIKVLGAVKIYVSAGKEQSVEVSTKPDYMERVKTWVENDTLLIDTTKHKRRHTKGMKVRMYVNVATLNAVDVEGAIDGRFEDISADDFTIDVEGASNMVLSGTCDTITIDMSGASNIEADDLECKNADIDMQGVGNIEAYASERVVVNLGGMGNVNVRGGATDVTKNRGGFGHIEVH